MIGVLLLALVLCLFVVLFSKDRISTALMSGDKVEVHFDRAGWIPYDPTPPDLRLRAAQTSWLAQMPPLNSFWL